MKIGILTGGGDVPGLNSCVKALVNRAAEEGHEVIGIRRGWQGLLRYNPADEENNQKYIVPLSPLSVRRVDRTGGTFLHTTRLNPSRVPFHKAPQFLQDADDESGPQDIIDYTPHILKVIEHIGLDLLIVLGGGVTLTFAHRLHTEGVPIIGIPKTMDNDVFGTDYCIGFSSAVSRSVEFIQNLRLSIGAHERVGVIELFGQHSGETCLISAYLADVNRAIISEVPFDPGKLAQLIMEDKTANPSNYAILVISEGATMLGGQMMQYGITDPYGNRAIGSIGEITGEVLKQITGENIIYQQVGYLARTGAPDAIDLMVAYNFASVAIDLTVEQNFGQLVAIRDGKYTNVPLDELVQGVKRVDVDELYDVQAYRLKVRHVRNKPMFLY